jgi:excisionase family DNA binding protein
MITLQPAKIQKHFETAARPGGAMSEEHFVSASELAEIYQISRDEIYRLAKRGIIPAHKIGGIWRFCLPDVKRCTSSRRDDDNGLDS